MEQIKRGTKYTKVEEKVKATIGMSSLNEGEEPPFRDPGKNCSNQGCSPAVRHAWQEARW